MCAKVSRKMVRAVATPSTSRTPHSVRQSPRSPRTPRTPNKRNQSPPKKASKTPKQKSSRTPMKAKKKPTKAIVARTNASDSEDPDESIDFLGRPPSVSRASSCNTSDSYSTPQETPKRSTNTSRRKQAQPKRRRKNHITRDILKLQLSTKLLIPRLPFQR